MVENVDYTVLNKPKAELHIKEENFKVIFDQFFKPVNVMNFVEAN